ncbi:MAG: aldo/keto reductase [Candidatus Heimdallarchaeota archaeon]|nr:MAG: aldo/keto reductase [Candidatus Heimdallarchaeota archaeon]
MKFKLLGKSGLRVSELFLGTMTFGEDWGWGCSKDVAKQVFNKYSDSGGNFIDTADNYANGTSEKFVGEFIQGDRDRFVIATKYTLHNVKAKADPNQGGNHRKNLIRSVNGSLERLKTDYIDLLYLHMWDFTTPLEEVMNSLNNLISSGKVHYIGISDTPAWIVTRTNTLAEQRGWNPFVAFQFPYNIGRRDPEREIMPMCRELDIAMTIWAPLAAGLLTGKYSSKEEVSGRLSEKFWGKPSEQAIKIAQKVDIIAKEIGCNSSQVALNWVRQQKGICIPIFSVTKLHQFEENISCLDYTLSDDHMQRLNEIAEFEIGFPMGFLNSKSVLDLIHGETYPLVLNHRLK